VEIAVQCFFASIVIPSTVWIVSISRFAQSVKLVRATIATKSGHARDATKSFVAIVKNLIVVTGTVATGARVQTTNTTNFAKDEFDLIRVWLPADLVCCAVPLYYLRLSVRWLCLALYLSFTRGRIRGKFNSVSITFEFRTFNLQRYMCVMRIVFQSR